MLHSPSSELLPPPLSPSTTPRPTTRTTLTRKRKSDHVNTIEPTNESFDATYLPKTGASVSFVSVVLLARACLPLACIDTNAQSSQGFVSHVLEANIPWVQEWEQRTLVARKAPNGGLHAIENVAPGIFTACQLRPWVSEQWCRDAAVGKVALCTLDNLLHVHNRTTHARTSSSSSLNPLPTPKSPKKPTHRRGALARQSILKSKDPIVTDVSSEVADSSTLPQQPSLPVMTSLAPSSNTGTAGPESQCGFEPQLPIHGDSLDEQSLQPSDPAVPPQDLLAPERLRALYFEHLYTSKTSLAFYVKGPLSRARAHLRSSGNSSTLILELADFYRQCILPTAKIDLKYKDSISTVINQARMDPEGATLPKKKGPKKKTKLGKDCLWPSEDDFVQKWWSLRDTKSNLLSVEDHAPELRRLVADLRMRETKMQLLLILEVMLLDLAMSRLSERPVPDDPDIKVESLEADSSIVLAKTPLKQPKKKRDLSVELEMMIDRLCIWHSISFEDVISIEGKNDNTKTNSNDSLRDFCKDVLIPFYSAKLPEQIKSISRKLAGSGISPQRPKPQKSSSLKQTRLVTGPPASSNPAKPAYKTKRTLERVLSEDQPHRHHSPPVLSRASTGPMMPMIPSLKREASERPVSRGGSLSKSMSFGNREIDLAADSQNHEAKRQKLDKLAQQKRELEDAIQALRKPSRSAMAGAFMDDIERRKTQPTPQVVHITATPRARRTQHQALDEPELPPMPKMSATRVQDFVVPSSTIKSRVELLNSSSLPRASAKKRAVLSAIHETPTRGLERKTSDPLSLGIHGAFERTESVAATPVARTRFSRTLDARESTSFARQVSESDHHLSSSQPQSPSRGPLKMSRSQRPVLFTPLRRSDVRIEDVFRDAPEIPASAGKAMDRAMGGAGRGEEIDLGLGAELMSDVLGVDSSPARKVAPLAPVGNVGASARSGNKIGEAVDEGDIYAQLGWNDDDDLDL
ncbi:hypothetical protein PV10_08522 [Exophiala mesophila]|uniref:DNA replication regulator Sld3 C-terminal domain-containing protein n=1 Tax=Exophiala mesophila TaxID=212818 RepID=A0A0D1XL19_EXOME|nr:uncharacterized protein PV10_08522 [Exophiala mesophila]KIV88891.1 hypothetical protein PV10_08522 [Exophiala mesophila]